MVWLDESVAWCLVGASGVLGWLWASGIVGYVGLESLGLGVGQVSVQSGSRGSGSSSRVGYGAAAGVGVSGVESGVAALWLWASVAVA